MAIVPFLDLRGGCSKWGGKTFGVAVAGEIEARAISVLAYAAGFGDAVARERGHGVCPNGA
ncbi:MAG: hypothetical protein JNK31_07495 [Candidatus Competibacter sp.]|nr:hypothetical protein [Candidatus Competibacter sp.]